MADFVVAAKLDELPPGQCKKVIINDQKVALFNVDGTVYATDDTCSHAEASLTEGAFEGHVVECPKHGAKFDVKTGEALTMPAWAPISTYEVKVEDGEIKVSV